MPPKASDSKKARKSAGGRASTAGNTVKPVSSRSARNASDDENAAPRRGRRAAATNTAEVEDEDDELNSDASDSDVAADLTASASRKNKSGSGKSSGNQASSPRKSGGAGGRQSLKGPPVSTSSSKAIKGGRPSTTGSASKKPASSTVVASSKKKPSSTSRKSTSTARNRTTTTTSNSDDGSDDESTPTTRSRSARGYTWEAEVITMKPEEVMEKLTYHSSIKTDIDADKDDFERTGEPKVKFKRDQMIYLLPDPATLPPRSEEIFPNDLNDDEFWVGRVLDCCALDQGPNSAPLGILRIAWFYSPDQVKPIESLHADWKKRLTKYRFDDYEMIASDHIDFVGVEAFCGYPEGRIDYKLFLHGLAVDDAERMKKPALRKKSTKLKRITGFPRKDGREAADDPDKYLIRLSHETPEEREKRLKREKRKEAKEKRKSKGGSSSQRRDAGSDEEDEATDEE